MATKPKGAQKIVPELSPDEKIAIEALTTYYSDLVIDRAYARVKDFPGGTLFLFADDDEHEYQVLVRNGEGIVYENFAETIRQTSKRWQVFDKVFAAETITGLLALMIGAAAVLYWYWSPAQFPDALSAALTTIIGFFFGKQTKAA